MDFPDLLERRSSAASSDEDAELKELCVRLQEISQHSLRLREIARNSYIKEPVRRLALDQLAHTDYLLYRKTALSIIEDTQEGLLFWRKHLVSCLRENGHANEAVTAIERHLARSSDYDARDVELLISAGARAKAIEHLEKLLARPDVPVSAQTWTVRTLTRIGASRTAFELLVSLVKKRNYAADEFREIAKRLLVTEHGAETREVLWRVLRQHAQDMTVRLVASELLYTPELDPSQHRSIEQFLLRVIRGRTVSHADRFEALDQLYDLDSDAALDLCLSKTESPETPFTDGMAAAERMSRWGNGDIAAESYYDVVWSAKRTPSEHIEGLLYICHHLRIDQDDDAAEDLEDLCEKARQELMEICADTQIDPELRLSALGLPTVNEPGYRQLLPAEIDVVENFLKDSTISLQMKRRCLGLLRNFSSPPAIAVPDELKSHEAAAISLGNRLQQLEISTDPESAARQLHEILCNPSVTISVVH